MAVKLTAARIDEHGSAKGGAAGDQNGREVCTHDYYDHAQGWVILRPYSGALAYEIAETAVVLARNDCIGYDQSQRLTLYEALERCGWDITKLTAKCECDCSAFVRAVLRCCGVQLPNFNTSAEISVLVDSGRFANIGRATKGGGNLCIGDILCTPKQGHTAIVTTAAIRTNDISSEDGDFVVRPGTWNLRERPGTDSRIITTLRGGTALQLDGTQWYHVITPEGLSGWISEKGVTTHEA